MKVQIKDSACIITREKGDPRFSGRINAAGESKLLYHVKNILNARGYDLIKKRMCKDGHLVSDMQQYLRARKFVKGNKNIAIWNSFWQVEGADEVLNRTGTVNLEIVKDFLFPKTKE